MARIQITDLDPADSGLMDELTDEELLAINGGGWFSRLVDAFVDYLLTELDLVR
jgi:hypothetical protein